MGEKLWLTVPDAPIVFLSAGVGITPVLAMLENVVETRPASWLHSATNGDVHAYRDRLRSLASVRKGRLQRRVWYSKPLPKDGLPYLETSLKKKKGDDNESADMGTLEQSTATNLFRGLLSALAIATVLSVT